MPASGALGPFLSAMMELRSQRLKEQAIEEQMKQEGMENLGKGISSGVSALGAGLTKGMEQNKLDTLGNTLGKQQYGADWQGGGVDEIKLREAMAQQSASRGNDLWKQEKQRMELANYYQQSPAALDAATRRKEDLNRTEFNKLSQDDKDTYQAGVTYSANARGILDKMAKAATRDDHNTLADQLRGLNAMASNRKGGVGTSLVSVPQFMSTADKEALAAYTEAQQTAVPQTPGTGGQAQTQAYVDQARKMGYLSPDMQSPTGMPPSGLGPYGVPQYSATVPAVPAPESQQAMAVQPGATSQFQPQQQPSAAAPSAGTGKYNVGEKRQWPDGTIYVYAGPNRGWVPMNQ